jgi:hypothetical protein
LCRQADILNPSTASDIDGHACAKIKCLVGCGFARNHSPIVELRVLAGQYIRTRKPVGWWTKPGGFDACWVERRFAVFEQSELRISPDEVKDLVAANRA